MALGIHGKFVCSICGKVIGDQEESVGFPPFLPQDHPLVVFSDSIMHKECFVADHRSGDVMDLYARYKSIWDSRPRDLKTMKEIEEWGRRAFRDFP